MIPGRERLRRQFPVAPRTRATTRPTTPAGLSGGEVIPFECAARFKITGVSGNIVQDVIQIGPEGVFIATAIGYGFDEERARPIILDVQPDVDYVPGDIMLGQIPIDSLIEGFRINPRLEPIALGVDPGDPLRRTLLEEFGNTSLAGSIVRDRLCEHVRPPADLAFLLSIIDSSTGRELQDEPVPSLAGLGKANGQRPFKPLARPLSFMPRSTVRLQVVERSPEVEGVLDVVLFGFKVLAPSGCPESEFRRLVHFFTSACTPPPLLAARAVPFDYVARLELNGTPGREIEDEIAVTVDGGFAVTRIGYGLEVESTTVEVDVTGAPGTAADLFVPGALKLSDLSVNALREGIRLRPSLLRSLVQPGGSLVNEIDVRFGPIMFERLNRPEHVSFRYAFFDSGAGRDLQNHPIHNVAGLGSADGHRPFKRLARPLVLHPRSTLRVRVTERFGRGQLYIVFQGYRALDRGAGKVSR